MPVYMYRREDGTTFEYRQRFTDDPLTVDPVSGQPVKRVVQAAGIVFKGSGFYVNDSKNASRKSITAPAKTGSGDGAVSTPSGADATPVKEASAPKLESSAAAD